MINWLNLVWMFVVVALLMWLVGNIVSVLLSFLLSSNTQRERFQLWALAALPWLFPLMSVGSLVLLSAAKHMGWIDDHCLIHTLHHPHFCFEHFPDILLGFSHSVTGIAGSVLLLTAIGWQVASQLKQHDKAKLLQRLTLSSQRVNLFTDSRPLAFTIGVRKPAIFLSDGLKSLLSRRQKHIVVTHELAHIRYCDVIKNTFFELLLSLHIFRSALRRRWRINTEVRADSYVTQRFDSLEVAEVLLKLQRAAVSSPFPVSIVGADAQMRINRLLQPVSDNKTMLFECLFIGLLIGFPVALGFHHHAVETLFGWWLAQ